MTTTELPLTTTTTTDQHTADTTTGGESIFSSDGLAPLPIPPPPAFFYSKQKNKTATTNNNDNDETKEEDDGDINDNACVLDSETSDPMQAFEIFQGRIFAPRGLGGGTGSTGGRTKATAESTMMRLARIERELKEMESESSKSLERQQQQRDDGDGDIDENDGAVRKVVEELSKRLVQLQDSSTGGGSTSGATRQNELTSLVRKEMDKLAAQTGSSLSSTKDDSGAASSETKEGSSGRVVYELYGNGSNTTSHRSSSTTAITNEQEERLNRIEAFLGSSSTSASTSSVVASHYDGKSSLLERLTQVEETLKSVDGNVLDNAAARAKVIRYVLEILFWGRCCCLCQLYICIPYTLAVTIYFTDIRILWADARLISGNTTIPTK